MQFLTLWTPAKPMSGPPSPEHMAEMDKLVTGMMKAGSLVTTGPLAPAADSVAVRHANGGFEVKKSPDALGGAASQGFALLEAPSLDAAIALSEKFMAVAGEGECQIRAIAMPRG